jgi:hypothetical protein
LRRLLATRLLSPQLGGEPNRFAILCAWLLAQDAWWQPTDAAHILDDLKRQGLNRDKLLMNADARMQNVIYWARYLGLIWQTGANIACGVVPDSTEYLRSHLDELLPDRSKTPILDFRDKLASTCPVLDGGAVRKSVLADLEKSGRRQAPGRLSDACSLGLQRLRAEKQIDFDCPNDAREFLVMAGEQRIKYVWRCGRA